MNTIPSRSSTFHLKFEPQRWLGLFSVSIALAGLADAQVTIGNSLIDGSNDGNIGGVYLYTDTFGQAGTANTWSFYDDDFNDRSVTPLLFQKINSTTFQLKGVGTTVTSTKAGAQSGNAFGLIAGSATVASDYTFGFTDRDVSYSGSGTLLTSNSSNGGVVDFQSSIGIWAFVPSSEGAFDLILDQNYEINATVDSDDSVISLFGTFDRQYSAQLTTSAVPEPATFGAWMSLVIFAGVGTRRRRRHA